MTSERRWLSPVFFFSSRRRHTRCSRDWSSDVCSSDLNVEPEAAAASYASGTGVTLTAAAASGSTFGGWSGGGCSGTGACNRSEKRRVGKEGRTRWAPDHLKKKTKHIHELRDDV